MTPKWLDWSRRLQAIAQTGLTFTKGEYDIERYHAIRAIAAEMLAENAGVPCTLAQGVLDREEG